MPHETAKERPQRIESVLEHTGTALRELRSTAAPGALSGIMAECWRTYLGPKERAFLMSVAVQAAELDDRYEMGFILGAAPPFRRS